MRKLHALLFGLGLIVSATACGSKATCADAVKNMETLDPDSKKESADELAKDIEKGTKRCEEKKPPQEQLDCLAKATDYKASRACISK